MRQEAGIEQSYVSAIIYVLYLLLFTQFGHEGESDLIWAYPLGMPFIYWPTFDKETPRGIERRTTDERWCPDL